MALLLMSPCRLTKQDLTSLLNGWLEPSEVIESWEITDDHLILHTSERFSQPSGPRSILRMLR